MYLQNLRRTKFNNGIDNNLSISVDSAQQCDIKYEYTIHVM